MSSQENGPAPEETERANDGASTNEPNEETPEVVEGVSTSQEAGGDSDGSNDPEDDITPTDAYMCIPYERHVASLDLGANKSRRAIRFTKDPKIYKHVRLAAYPGLLIYNGFDDMPMLGEENPPEENPPVRVVAPGTYVTYTCMQVQQHYSITCMHAGLLWNFSVPGGTKTMCCLCGFKVHMSPECVVLVEEMIMRKALANGERPGAQHFVKIQVLDLFHHGKPTETVDVELRDYAEQIKTFFLQVNGADVSVWRGLPMVRSAHQQNMIQQHLDAQARKIKEKQQAAEKRKKMLQERALQRQKEREQNAKRAQEARAKRSKTREKERQQRRNKKRKLEREVCVVRVG